LAVTIHSEPRIAWHAPFAAKMAQGLKALGIPSETTNSQQRQSDIAILLGTTFWRQIEADGRYLLVDRCSFGDTNQYVSLVWDGHGRRGNHCVPENYSYSRWTVHGVPLKPFASGAKSVICGQTESYSPHWKLRDWYQAHHRAATHFRPHPGDAEYEIVRLPVWKTWDDVRIARTLNSSVAIDALINGVEATVDDYGGMAFAWSQCNPETDRLRLMRWLAWTQWHHSEIAEGKPIEHILDRIAA